MDLQKMFGTDKKLEEQGVWVEIDEKSKIKVARLGNLKFREFSRKLQNNAKIATKYKIDDFNQNDLVKLLANTILLDWEGIELNGEVLPYSIENAIKILTEFKDFTNLVVELANQMETFKNEDIDGAKKNLGE